MKASLPTFIQNIAQKECGFRRCRAARKNGSFPLAVDCICRSARIRTFSTRIEYQKRAWNHEIMAILSKKSGKLRILAPKIRTNCVPNKIFINFSAILYIVYQGDKTIYHCLSQAQIDGFSFFWHMLLWFLSFKFLERIIVAQQGFEPSQQVLSTTIDMRNKYSLDVESMTLSQSSYPLSQKRAEKQNEQVL